MAELSVDMTYATALFEAAGDAGKIDQIREEAEDLLVVFDEEKDFHRFFHTPNILADEKKEVLQNVLGDKVSAEFLHFLFILIDKGRVRHLARITKAYGDLVDRAEGFAVGEVFSARPLSDGQIERAQEEVGKLIGGKVKLENRVDKSLIGGMKIQVAGKLFDASIRRRLDDMKLHME